jgi:mannose-6-phosphate isomerase-like protein (cupin superfamily)
MEKKYTFFCKFCGKEKTTNDKNALYCDKKCESNYSKNNIEKESKCIVCQNEFKHYGEKVVCSKDCLDKYIEQKKIGENNAKSKEEDSRSCVGCNLEFKMPKHTFEKNRTFCSLACKHKVKKHIDKEKLLFEKDHYNPKKEKVCAICGENNTISHKIGKTNSINLCKNCKCSAEEEPIFWEIIFSGIVSGSKIVNKDWGAEIHIANSNDYCLKYLIFFNNKQFSHHFHNLKKELWHCIYGSFECVLEKKDEKIHLNFEQGQKIEIEAGVIHQLQANQNSILVEVSTRDYPEDSIREFKGDNL